MGTAPTSQARRSPRPTKLDATRRAKRNLTDRSNKGISLYLSFSLARAPFLTHITRRCFMWIVKLALNRPYTFIVFAFLIFVLSPSIILPSLTDIFPHIY